jgi:ribosomal protein L37AE/L43A
MAMNRIQFQPGMSMTAFLAAYGTEALCRAALEDVRWPDGFRCPRCGEARHSRHERGGQLLLQCSGCRHQASLIAGTVFEASKLPLTRWFLALFLLSQSKNNVSALSLKRHLGVCYQTAWDMKHKLMDTMAEAEQTRVLAGRVELDDAYLGGERNGGKVGRGSENKVPFLAAVQTNDEGHPIYVRFDPVAGFTQEALKVWGQRHLSKDTVVYSDGLSCFSALASWVSEHRVTVVGSGRKSAQQPQFRWVNILLSNLKRALSGTYHAFKFAKYARRYLAETAYRFNRRFCLEALLPALLGDCILAKPLPRRSIRLAEVCR